ncbi:hypothetical protein [Spiroplasma poulsonii]|uniref:Uncharacterized protein n=1 Tax=Spiroplasma poulsonii TaxID=2138 RepID=A0A2P6FER1_9MOLU|nr:hypothetical protein [Spiroplasma poulsonii]KAF0850486.1 hypothetical protein MSROBK_017490 [Spiroplasma poulsonii]PQM31844.1 hypothetical protein SMSRO_SF017010 [Spiroplasma poulsonii]PWF94309.1 hypothetical protein SMH99_22930 [Spiroplasma poulsonii]PWF96880.1 hypothetical protein SMSE_23270 [Spiroplasma poulsonii]
MPIGTSKTALIYAVKKNPTRLSIQQQEKSFGLQLLEFLGIQVLALGLSVLTGGVASAIGLGAGLSNFAAAFISFGVETATDFAVNQIYDKLTSEVTVKSTALNLLPAIGGIGKLTRSARTTRILKLAKETKLLEKLGVITANNLEDVVKQITGKKILSDKLIFDFTKQVNNETLLYTIGKLARNDFYKDFKVSNLETINNLLKIEKNIQKISPTLVQKIPRINEKNANKWLSEYGLNIEKISKISTNEWYNIMTNLHKKGVGKNLLLNANLMRGSKIYNNKLLNLLHQTPIKLNKTLNYLNPNFYIQKVTKKLLAPIEKQIITIKQKVISKITDKTKKILSKFETKAIKKGQLLPFAYGSDVFLAVKIVPLSVTGEVALTIYYKNTQYAPIVVMTTLIKAEQFVLASEPFKFYMNSEWFIGWGFKKTSLFNLVSFAPLAYQQVVKDSFKIYRTIAKILKMQEQFKNNFNKDKFLNTLEDSAITSLLGNGLVFQTYKQLRTKQDLNKTIKTKTLLNSKKFILKKIYSKKSKW